MRLFIFIAYCAGAAFAAVFSMAFVEAVYSSQRVINGEGVSSELSNADILQNQSYVFREEHTVDLNRLEGMVMGESHQHFPPMIWETDLGVFSTSYVLLNFAVFAVVGLVVIFLIRLGSKSTARNPKRLRRGKTT